LLHFKPDEFDRVWERKQAVMRAATLLNSAWGK